MDVTTDRGDEVRCRLYVMASGCLSAAEGARHRGRRAVRRRDVPHQPLAARAASTWPAGGWRSSAPGSSGIQSIPILARQAARADRVPAHAELQPARPQRRPRPREGGATSRPRTASTARRPASRAGGQPRPVPVKSALDVDARGAGGRYEEALGARGSWAASSAAYTDLVLDQAANDTVAEFVRGKIRAIVDDPGTAEMLCPTDYPFATKRPCLDTGYYATFNLPDVAPRRPAGDADRGVHRDRRRHGDERSSSTSSSSPPASTP